MLTAEHVEGHPTEGVASFEPHIFGRLRFLVRGTTEYSNTFMKASFLGLGAYKWPSHSTSEDLRSHVFGLGIEVRRA